MSSIFEIASEYQIGTDDWVYAILSALILGISKGGVKGLGALVVTLMAFAFEVKVSVGIVLVLLIFGDILAVLYYNKKANWKYIFKLMPWMIIGVLIGAKVGDNLPKVVFKQCVAIIILITVIMMFIFEYQKDIKVPKGRWFAGVMGLSAGFTTMIGNLAGAFSNIFFLAMQVPKMVFIGTAAWLFFIVNVFKIPFHIWYWETVQVNTIGIVMRLLPVVLIGFFIGVRIVRVINEKAFRKLILLLTAMGAILIFFK